jgi:hypothetical protein
MCSNDFVRRALVKDAKHRAVDEECDLSDLVAEGLRRVLAKKGGK